MQKHPVSFTLVLSILLTCAPSVLSAQGPPDGGPTPEPTAVPLDGGASLLLAAGAAYGVHRLRNRFR